MKTKNWKSTTRLDTIMNVLVIAITLGFLFAGTWPTDNAMQLAIVKSQPSQA